MAIGDSFDITLGVYDDLGELQNVPVTFTRTSDLEWSWTANGTGVSGSGSIVFDSNGQYSSSSGTITIPGSNGANFTVTPDFSGVTQLATDHSVAEISQDGLAAGSFASFYVTPDTGEIYGVYSNGMQQLFGQLALSTFVNPSGLLRIGQNLYLPASNSGEPVIGTASTGGRGSIAAGYLENSNVDLGREFTNMILAQRGFQASSRVITTSDEMLQELVNLKR